jgi:hypothetical protein
VDPTLVPRRTATTSNPAPLPYQQPAAQQPANKQTANPADPQKKKGFLNKLKDVFK